MSSPLQSEDFENVPLVRMEDVQPIDRSYVVVSTRSGDEVSCIIENIEYENECVLNNEDSNIGSMVSIHSEEVVHCEDSDGAEMIVPEVLDPPLKAVPVVIEEKTEIKPIAPDSWPTLEILPGGVIKHADKCDNDLGSNYPGEVEQDGADSGEMMYACAKCSQSFKYLYSLVKHVKLHEDEQKKLKGSDLAKLKPGENGEYVCLHKGKKRIFKTNKRKLPKKPKS